MNVAPKTLRQLSDLDGARPRHACERAAREDRPRKYAIKIRQLTKRFRSNVMAVAPIEKLVHSFSTDGVDHVAQLSTWLL